MSIGGDLDEVSYSVASDRHGNSYVAGSFSSDTVAIGDTTLFTLWGKMFLVKLDSSGNIIWVKSEGGSNINEAYGVAVDASANVYVAGYFIHAITFDTITFTTGPAQEKGFVVSYDSAGTVRWARSVEGTSNSEVHHISTDAHGNCYVAGDFGPGMAILDSITLVNPNPGEDWFLAKLDSVGDLVWVNHVGLGFGSIGFRSLHSDPVGNTLIGGSFDDSIRFDTILLTGGLADMFVVKHDPSGHAVWADAAGGPSLESATGVTIDASGNCIVAGAFNSAQITIDTITLTSGGGYDLFVAKYDPGGQVLWAKNSGATFNDGAGPTVCDALGDIYVGVSTVGDSLLLDSTLMIGHLALIRMDPDGKVEWALTASSGAVWDLSINSNGDLVAVGAFQEDTARFGDTTLVKVPNTWGPSYVDAFVAHAKAGAAVILTGVPDTEWRTVAATVAPNPTTGSVMIRLPVSLEQATLSVLDMTGRVVHREELEDVDRRTIVLPPPAGLYIISINDGQQHIARAKVLRL
jgi:hypothetical protein